MKYGTLVENPATNARIHACLEQLDEEDARKFIRAFRNHAASGQIAHTYRDLLAGAYLASIGVKARYEREVLGKTPDWTIVRSDDTPDAIVELTTYHQTPAVDNEIAQTAIKGGKMWAGFMPPNSDRLYQKIQQKAEKYESLAATLSVPYVVAVFSEFTASVDRRELEEALLHIHGGGVFHQCPALAGVLHFRESGGLYRFSYFANPTATHTMVLRDAVL